MKKRPKGRGKRQPATGKSTTPTAKERVQRKTHVNRSQAHTSASGRRRQARRDTR